MNNSLIKIANLQSSPIIQPKILEKLNKLINITATSQWKLLNLTDQECDEIEAELENIQQQISVNHGMNSKIRKCKHENIPIILPNEDFL